MDAIVLRNPRALLIPDVMNLLKRAVESVNLCAPGGFDSVAQDIINFVADDQQFMILGAEDSTFKAVILGFFPTGNLFPYPTVMLYYNEGSRELSKVMRDKVYEYLLGSGYTRMVCINMSGYPDEIWMRALKVDGVTAKIIGSMAEFEVS